MNSWYAELELMDDPLPSIAVMNGKRPFIYGILRCPFPDTAFGVRHRCVDAIVFSFQTKLPKDL